MTQSNERLKCSEQRRPVIPVWQTADYCYDEQQPATFTWTRIYALASSRDIRTMSDLNRTCEKRANAVSRHVRHFTSKGIRALSYPL